MTEKARGLANAREAKPSEHLFMNIYMLPPTFVILALPAKKLKPDSCTKLHEESLISKADSYTPFVGNGEGLIDYLSVYFSCNHIHFWHAAVNFTVLHPVALSAMKGPPVLVLFIPAGNGSQRFEAEDFQALSSFLSGDD